MTFRPEAPRAGAPRAIAILAGLAGLVVLWGIAVLVAADDIDFFNPDDFRDTAAPHHEHIVVALLVLGLAPPVLSILVLGRRAP